MPIPNLTKTLTATVASAGTDSNVLDVRGAEYIVVHLPTITGTTCAVKSHATQDATGLTLYAGATTSSVTVASSRAVRFSVQGCTFVSLVLAAQGAERTIPVTVA